MNYIETIASDEGKNVCVDFDGVIHNNFQGFGDGTVYGNVIEGAKEALHELSQNYDIIIFTAKAREDRPLIDGKTGKELVWEWLKLHNLDAYVADVTAEKPRALVYIDDKAIRFTNWQDTLTEFGKLYVTK